jgi:hypothetical protein
LKFPENSRLSPEAKDLICRFLCDVDHRIGSEGADQIKVFVSQYICGSQSHIQVVLRLHAHKTFIDLNVNVENTT